MTLFLALALTALAGEGKIYECRDAQGQVVYQDEPCLEAAPAQSTATPKSPTKAKPPAKPKPASKPKPKAAQVPLEPTTGSHPVDARWATPEQTLQTFINAVEAGDRALVGSCLTSEALADLGPDLEDVSLEKLRQTVGSFTGYVWEGDLGPFWSVRALRAGLRPKWIFFERMRSGEWKIASI